VADRSPEQILGDARETLEDAQVGLADLKTDDPRLHRRGLRYVATFGVATTQTLQGLRSVVTNFDQWYGPHRAVMKADAVCRYFWVRRRMILHQGTTGTHSAVVNITEQPPRTGRVPSSGV